MNCYSPALKLLFIYGEEIVDDVVKKFVRLNEDLLQFRVSGILFQEFVENINRFLGVFLSLASEAEALCCVEGCTPCVVLSCGEVSEGERF